MSSTQAASSNPSDLEEPSAEDEVRFGRTVSFVDRRNGRRQAFRIVSPHEAEPTTGSLSVHSPVAVALLHHHVGEVIEVSTPSGLRPLQITGVS